MNDDGRTTAQVAVALERAIEGLNYNRCKHLIAVLREKIGQDDVERADLRKANARLTIPDVELVEDRA